MTRLHLPPRHSHSGGMVSAGSLESRQTYVPYSGWSGIPFSQTNPNTARFGNEALARVPVSLRSVMGAVKSQIPGGGGPIALALGAISGIMAFIESNKLVELFITDFGAMVAPRTLIDWNKRGFDAGREVFFREIMGSLTNVFLVGWAGFGSLWATKHLFFNPKGMNYHAWIDTPTLNYFGEVTKEVLEEARKAGNMTGQDIQRSFLTKVLSRIESTDGIAKMYKEYLPYQGRISPDIQKQVIEQLLHHPETIGPHVNNIEAEVFRQLQQNQYQATIKEVLKGAQYEFRRVRGLKPGEALTPLQKEELKKLLIRERYTVLTKLKSSLRLTASRQSRKVEGEMLKALHKLLTTDGHLTGEVVFKHKGHINFDVGTKSLQTTLNHIKYYLEEFLTRSLADAKTGSISRKVLGSDALIAIENRLFKTSGHSWVAQNVLPRFKDGLLPYAFKSKRFLVGIPLLFTLAVGYSTVLINNYITSRKYGGKVFFPGEEMAHGGAHGGRG